MAKRSFFALFTGLTLGAIVGAVSGVLYAPKKGEETRKELKEKLEKVRVQGEESFKRLKERGFDPAVKDLRAKLKTGVNDVKKSIEALDAEEIKDKISDAAIEAKEKVSEFVDDARDTVETKSTDIKHNISTRVKSLQKEVRERLD